jgi:serine phosphatase RsbU (regulator of sigma subunit)
MRCLYTYILIFSFGFFSLAQNLDKEARTKIDKLIHELDDCKNDTIRLDKLFEIHYLQLPLLGELNEHNISQFNTDYTKQAIAIATKLHKLDTLKSLTIDIGYIFDLSKHFDSSFTYYNNCLNVFESTGNFNLIPSLTQNILYNNSLLQSIIEEDSKKEILQQKKIDKLTFIAFTALLLFIAFIAYFFYRLKRNNKLLESQKKVISDSKNEIDKSIHYAQNIQEVILSNEIKLKQYFEDVLVLFMPRDKVSGDFLWSYKNGKDIYVAVADCTGHGVPGALLSIVGHFSLNSVVTNSQEKSPAAILEKLHHTFVETLNQQNSVHNNEGMDVALCRIDTESNTLFFAGAYRPLYHGRNGVVTEYKGIKRPIGGTQRCLDKDFVEHEIRLQKGDVIYCYSDGYSDQFGGPSNKKFLNANFVKLIGENLDKSLAEQKEVFKTNFIIHKGSNRQTDDVLLVGIKF